MTVAFVASEVAPFAKSGGLADVAGALPKALDTSDCTVTVYMPLHSAIPAIYREQMTYEGYTTVSLGWRTQYVGVMSLEHEGVMHYFIDNAYYFNRWRLYGEDDDGERYVFFSKAVLAAMKMMNAAPDILHANDWHTAAIPVLLHYYRLSDPFYADIHTVFTIHNLRFQGIFDPVVMRDLMELPETYYTEDRLKYYDRINLMKGGIVFSDALTTVSESYAEEITYPFFGEHLDGIISANRHKLVGIVNGIDTEVYAPKNDPNLPVTYDLRSINRKKTIKAALQRQFDLPENPDIPMLAMVTRLDEMKGIDLVTHILDELLQMDVQFVLLGTGEPRYEEIFRSFQYRYPDKMAARIYFDQKASHEIYAGADIFVMPSLFEPCGLSQMIAMRYGTLPVVRQVGGLKDTVIPYNQYTGEGNGFGFMNYNAHELLFTLKDALTLYEDTDVWRSLIKQAMRADNSWSRSSKRYLSLYKFLAEKDIPSDA